MEGDIEVEKIDTKGEEKEDKINPQIPSNLFKY